jgi:hypothetical protein
MTNKFREEAAMMVCSPGREDSIYYGRKQLVKDVADALQAAHQKGKEEERERCAEVCRNAPGRVGKKVDSFTCEWLSHDIEALSKLSEGE